MVYMHGEGMNTGDLQHIAFSEDPSPTGDRNGEDSRVLAECVPSWGGGGYHRTSVHAQY